MKRYLPILFLLFLLVSCKPSGEPFVVSEGGAAVYAQAGDSVPVRFLAAGDTVRLKLNSDIYSTFREGDHTCYVRRSELEPLYWAGRMERMADGWAERAVHGRDSVVRAISSFGIEATERSVAFLFLTVSVGALLVWLTLRRVRSRMLALCVGLPLLALAAVVSALQLSFDDPAWFCSPSVVGWGWTLAGFALFAGCVWTQMLLAGRVIGVWTNSRGMPFRPDWRLPALAVGVFIVLLLAYPVTTIWLDYRVMTALLYGLPALLCVLFLLLTAVRFLWHTRCGLGGRLIALVALLLSTLMLINLCLLAIAILFFVIAAVAALLFLGSVSMGTAAGGEDGTVARGGEGQPQWEWHSCSSCPHAGPLRKDGYRDCHLRGGSHRNSDGCYLRKK